MCGNEIFGTVIHRLILFVSLQGEAGVPGFRGTPGIPVSCFRLCARSQYVRLK